VRDNRAVTEPPPRVVPVIAHAAEVVSAKVGRPVEVATIAANLGFVMRTTLGLAVLAIGANVAASAIVAGMIVAINKDLTAHQLHVTMVVGGVFVGVAAIVGTVCGTIVQRRTLRWLLRGEEPSEQEAHRALSMPRDLSVIVIVLWAVGAGVVASTEAAVGGTGRSASAIFGGLVVTGLVAAGITYLLADRVSRPVTRLVLETWPPRMAPLFDLRWRLMLVWALTSGTPIIGIILVLTGPGHRGAQITSTAVTAGFLAFTVGAFATYLAARSIGAPLRELVAVLGRVGEGDLDVSVPVEDAGEIGLVQNVVNEMVDGLRERDRISDLFGRHVGPAVAEQALRSGVTLSGELRTVVALFVDITGSTVLTQTMDPVEFVAMLNRFFAVVVEEVEAQGGLVNKFQGDAALAVFGAPVQLIDPATSALRAARRMRDRVLGMGEVEVGIGVAYGSVVAGQVGARSRLEFTVIGDAVNEASRLTDLAKTMRQHVLASRAVVEHAAETESEVWAPAGEAVLRGRAVPTEFWTA
jgi:adenylate cyclase